MRMMLLSIENEAQKTESNFIVSSEVPRGGDIDAAECAAEKQV